MSRERQDLSDRITPATGATKLYRAATYPTWSKTVLAGSSACMKIKRFTITMLLCAAFVSAQDEFLSPTKIVRTAQGLVLGLSDGKVDQFLGLPYAAPPVGDLRWKAPLDAPAWSGVRDAVRQSS